MKIRFKENLIQKVSLGDFWETNVPSRGNHQWQARGSTKAVRQKDTRRSQRRERWRFSRACAVR